MKRFLSVALTLGLAAGVAACNDDFLTTPPQDVIEAGSFWQTERDFTLGINAAYRNVTNTDLHYLDGATDLAYSQKDWMPNHAYAQGHQGAATGWSSAIWGRLYQGISRANEVLTQLEAPGGAALPEQTRARIRAQARFLRGYFYHELLWLYGGVPIFTSGPSIPEAREASRASREEVFAQIRSDLEAAAAPGVLPTSWPAAEYGRATRGAALAFLARAALYEASYQKYAATNPARANELFQLSADASRAVIDLGVYRLHSDFRELFTYAGEGSAEVIFDYQRVKGVNGWPAWAWFAPHSMGGNIDVTPTRALVDRFRMRDGRTIQESPLYDPSPPVIQDGQVVSLGMYANRDARLSGTVLFPGGTLGGRVYNSFPDSPTADRVVTSNFSNTHTGYVALKYVDPADQADPSNSGINHILMRYADVLLMYAEAKVELNQIDGTVEAALNQIRDRVGMPRVTLGSQQQMIDLIRNERVVELALEGLRLADIRRWRIAEQVLPGTVAGIDVRDANGSIITLRGLWQRNFTAPRDYLWPIPLTETDLNANLRENQNPGY